MIEVEMEFERRLASAQCLMAEDDIDVLMLFTGHNLSYFATAPGALGGRSGARPYVLLVPREGKPILIVHRGRAAESERFSNVSNVRAYSGLSLVPTTEISAALRDLGLIRGRCGVELGSEMVMDLPSLEFDRLKIALPGHEFVDASRLLWRLRMVKSPMEIAAIEQACQITGNAYRQCYRTIEAGMTEFEIHKRMTDAMTLAGGATPWAIITSGEGNYDLVSKSPVSRKVVAGDMVWIDAGCTIDGYYSDYGRATVVGGPSRSQAEAQELAHEITLETAANIRPGLPIRDLVRTCNTRLHSALRGARLPVTSIISDLADRIGHGLGMLITEPPSLTEEEEMILIPGMVITIEPGFATPYGTFHVEENVVVTDTGSRILSDPHWRLDHW
jgi:Xaa-Pro dipeptidase